MENVAERKKKFFLMLPLFVIPFLTLLFYGLGGGKARSKNTPPATGLNASLPAAQLAEEGDLDKLAMYKLAEKEALHKQETAATDPYLFGDSSVAQTWPPAPAKPTATTLLPAADNPVTATAASEAQVEQRLALLQQLVTRTDTTQPVMPIPTAPPAAAYPPGDSLLLTTGMPAASLPPQSGDAQLDQLEGMLEKIIDIQHPELLQEKIKKASLQNTTAAFPVIADTQHSPVAELMTTTGTAGARTSVGSSASDGFYELETPTPEAVNNAVAAVVHESQVLVSGATIKLRLQQNAFVQGVLIPAGSFVYGSCQLQADRLQVNIPSIRYGSSIFSVSLQVYDGDGLPGIRIPGSVSRDAAKEGSQQAMQALAMGSLDPSLGAQAAAAGIETAKNLLGKKIRLIKVTVKADHPVLLVSN
ncbi:conjugative transposon protein TraM [Chitinophaga filiformis]|uniref:Conjugative transposon protein TraM n=1 Tax=Chitinophaga filiformis TaxID=104663 RepID=A0ABY4HX67_CHIFI|nr:conjugative transposon protein TraM [Chitinophaga filiformis]UPK68023.1 conjugative transposon protein TraM [Chitinophaga filiformis]